MPDAREAMREQLRAINDNLDKYPKLAIPAAKKGLRTFGVLFQNKFTKESLSGRPGVQRRSGDLAKSFSATVEDSGKGMRLVVWSRSKYAALQEYGTAGMPGGVLRPKNGKYLAIPMGPALTGTGVARWKSPKDGPQLEFLRSKSGKAFLARMEGGKLVIYYALVKSVKIEGRLSMRKKWLDMVPQGVEMVKQEIDMAINPVMRFVNNTLGAR